MANKNRTSIVTQPIVGPIDCACVIHGDLYSWKYVNRLYSMLSRNITQGIRLHVYTEEKRLVPEPYIKHILDDWKISGPKKSWWYKMQLFNTAHHAGPLLYFDLDTVIVKNIDWIVNLPLSYFWAVRDFKYLWKPIDFSVNSSIMWWDTRQYQTIWSDFAAQDINKIVRTFRGDQDYINHVILPEDKKLFNTELVKSWRWQNLDGGYDFKKRIYYKPGTGTNCTDQTAIMVFHGDPKPGNLEDPVVLTHWQ